MAPAFQLLFSLLTLQCLALSCQSSDKPLLLSPYLDKGQVEKARNLSKVDKSCLEDFVPESYTGFLTVDKELGNHLFFWFFPSTENEKAPLLLWLNGGPGVSSMLGLFWEHGPMNLGAKTECGKKQEESPSGYTQRKHSWTGPFSMLYVDNPVNVGYSFSDFGERGQRVTEEGYTKDMFSFLIEFFKLCPEYKTREVYIGGQSYAGKYISALAYEIHTHKQKGSLDFDLTGIYLGAPWYDPETQFHAFYEFLYAMGFISHKGLQDAKAELEDFYSKFRGRNQGLPIEAMYKESVNLYSLTPYITSGSLDNLVTGEHADYEGMVSMMSRPEIKKAAHTGNRDYVGPFGTSKMREKLVNDWYLISTKLKMTELMDNYKVLIYNGDFDVIVSTPMLEASLLSTPWKFQSQYNNTITSPWRRNGEFIGHYSLTGKFCRVVIHGAGHQVPREKPEVALQMMNDFVAHGCVKNFSSVASAVTSSASLSPLIFLTWTLVLNGLILLYVTVPRV